jgi:hypothetical protein
VSSANLAASSLEPMPYRWAVAKINGFRYTGPQGVSTGNSAHGLAKWTPLKCFWFFSAASLANRSALRRAVFAATAQLAAS